MSWTGKVMRRVPRPDEHPPQSQLFHYILEWRQAGGDVFRLVGERFEESSIVFLAIETRNEGYQVKW